jgi:hypothetical protein
MIDVLFEQRIIQSTGLAAEAIWQAVHEAYDLRGRRDGVPFPLVFLVLPLAFHERTAASLASKTQPGALYKALAADREITVDLQRRLEGLSDRTFQALSIAFQTGLLAFDAKERQLVPVRKSAPITHVTDEVKVIMSAAKRVGQAFGEMSTVQIITALNVRF